jgi:hypothetical protein
MGLLPGKEMPMGLTFAGKAYEDTKLLSWAYAYEQKSLRRKAPRLVPELPTDVFPLTDTRSIKKAPRPQLHVEPFNVTDVHDPSMMRVVVHGSVTLASNTTVSSSTLPEVRITVGTFDIPTSQLEIERVNGNSTGAVFNFEGWAEVERPIEPDVRFRTTAKVARDMTMVVVLARAENGGMPSGFVEMI